MNNSGSLMKFLEHSGIGQNDWDVLLIADGSGSGWDSPTGWAVVVIDRLTGIRKVLYGGQNRGTINAAEVHPFLWGIRYYHNVVRKDKDREIVVCCLSDSEITVKCGQGVYKAKTNIDLWQALKYWESRGYIFRWQHVPRETLDLQILTDEIAGRARTKIKEVGDVDERRLYSV